MTDSTEDSGVASLLKKINKTLKKYFDVRRERAVLKLEYDKKTSKLTGKYQRADGPLATLEEELAITLRALIVPNRALLLTGRLKSFSTHFGKVYFSYKPVSYKLKDDKVSKAGFEKRARDEHRLTTLGKFVRLWKPNARAIDKWLQSDKNAARRYGAFVEKTGDYDELLVQPDDPYFTDHDPNRLTAPSVNLGPVIDDVKDESPDA